MATYSLITYMVLDELKLRSDDATYQEEHVIFLADKYRALLLKLKYSDIKKEVPLQDYQTICMDLIQVPAISGEPCEGGTYLRSSEKVPSLITIGNPVVSTVDYYLGNITYVSRERMRYVGHNKYLQNIIYCSLGPDGYLYFKSNNPQYLYLELAKFTGVFEDTEEASNLSCDNTGDSTKKCDVLERDFPLEDALIPTMIGLIVKELLGAEYRPQDDNNNAADDLANLATFLSRNAKSALAKQLEQ